MTSRSTFNSHSGSTWWFSKSICKRCGTCFFKKNFIECSRCKFWLRRVTTLNWLATTLCVSIRNNIITWIIKALMMLHNKQFDLGRTLIRQKSYSDKVWVHQEKYMKSRLAIRGRCTVGFLCLIVLTLPGRFLHLFSFLEVAYFYFVLSYYVR